MQKIVVYLFFVVFFSSCKRSYTGFNTFKADANARKMAQITPIKLDEFNNEIAEADLRPSAELVASNAVTFSENDIIEKIKKVEKIENRNTNISNNNFVVAKKLTLKEKIVHKIVQKQLKKANATATSPNGFNNLDGKLKIGLILLAIAIGLSILGFGSLAGLAGLIGLIFVVIGLLNMYN